MGVDQNIVQEIVQRVLAVCKPTRIILFGSAAIGQMTRHSDVEARSSMRVREEAISELVRQWLTKAEADLGVASHLVLEARYLDAVGFTHNRQVRDTVCRALQRG